MPRLVATCRFAVIAAVMTVASPPPVALCQPPGPTSSTPTSSQREEPEKPVAVTTPLGGVLGNLRFNGLIQGWYLAASGATVDTFRLRRTELKLSAEVGSHAAWVVMIDPSKSLSLNKEWANIEGRQVVADTSVNQASRILQDAFITIKAAPHVQVSVGQMKLPLGLEGLASSSALSVVERALFLSDRPRGGSYGDVRDLGAMVRGTVSRSLDYSVGLFNGAGQTQNDLGKADRKVVSARLHVHPDWLHGLRVGVSAARGIETRLDVRQERTGLDLEYLYDDLTLRFELMTGQDAALKRKGYYVHAGYKILPTLELAGRVDTWDPDTALDSTAAAVGERDYVASLNYFISRDNVKCQLHAARKTFASGVTSDKTQVLTNLQVSW